MLRRILLVTLLNSTLLTGCGFALRRTPTLRFRTVQLVGFHPNSALAVELRHNIDASDNTRVVESHAQVVFEALADAREKSVVASTSAGLVREIQVRVRLSFRLKTPAGKELIPPTVISLGRDMSYNEGAALAKEYEQTLLYEAMQSDIVSQVMHRLAAVKQL